MWVPIDAMVGRGSFAIFPGQGAQVPGMGRDLHDQFAIARHVFAEASDAIDLDLRKLCFSGSIAELTLTENTQPALLAVSVAAFRVTEAEIGFQPSLVAGHSLGEYSALVATRCIDLTTATRWVRTRGQAMQRAVPEGLGSMLAILGAEDQVVEQACRQATALAGEAVEPANYNAPGQIVVAGSNLALEALRKILAQGESGKATPRVVALPVSAPFHSSYMEPARLEMLELLHRAEAPQDLVIPYVPNTTAQVCQEAQYVREHLIEQMIQPVRWTQSVHTLLGYCSRAVEFGPGRVLSQLIKRIASHQNLESSQHQVGEAQGLKELEGILKGKSG